MSTLVVELAKQKSHTIGVRSLVEIGVMLAGGLVFHLGIAGAGQLWTVLAEGQLPSGKPDPQLFPIVWASEDPK